MPTVPLLGGNYQGRSTQAASRLLSVNLYPERNPEDGQPLMPVTYYQTPGLTNISTSPNIETVRTNYRATNGALYVVVGPKVYSVSSTFTWTLLGTIADRTTPLIFADNGLTAVLVDGSTIGYAIDLATNDFGVITDPSFLGALSVAQQDTFFAFNRPGTNQFYLSLSNVTFAQLTGATGRILTSSLVSGGTGYVNGSYTNIALTGGTGTGATVDVTVSGGIATAATINAPGTGYSANDTLSVLHTDLGSLSAGGVLTGSISAGGSSYTNGTYTTVPLTGGAGTGAQATVVVSGGAVTSVTITAKGSGYAAADSLSAAASSIGGTGSGFTYLVGTVATNLVFSADTVATAFNPLDVATKSSSSDPIVAIASIHGVLWLIGQLTSEIWAPSGAADFYFQRIPGAVIDHGMAAPYSLAQQDVSLFWLSQDRQGHGIIVKGQDTAIVRISTNALEADIQNYSNISDAIGFCHQIDGHSFYVLSFPSADVTWAYDLSTGQWHRRMSIDGNGYQHRWRANCFAFAFGYNLVGDYQNGKIYALDSAVYTDDGTAIVRILTLPHLASMGRRCEFAQLQAKMQVGYIVGTPTSTPPLMTMRYSNDAGASYVGTQQQSIGASGQYITSPQFQRLGLARDRVFELSWSANADVAIAGVWVNYKVSAT